MNENNIIIEETIDFLLKNDEICVLIDYFLDNRIGFFSPYEIDYYSNNIEECIKDFEIYCKQKKIFYDSFFKKNEKKIYIMD